MSRVWCNLRPSGGANHPPLRSIKVALSTRRIWTGNNYPGINEARIHDVAARLVAVHTPPLTAMSVSKYHLSTCHWARRMLRVWARTAFHISWTPGLVGICDPPPGSCRREFRCLVGLTSGIRAPPLSTRGLVHASCCQGSLMMHGSLNDYGDDKDENPPQRQ
jgi:hypothetical protein